MPFSSPFHRDRLLRTKEYTASSLFSSSFAFYKEGKGHALKVFAPGPIDPNGPAPADAIIIAVGMVSESNMWLSPSGNWSPNSKYQKPFSDAKYTFQITKPIYDPTFKEDFPITVAALQKVQTSISVTGNNKWLLDQDGSEDTIRFATRVFETKDPDPEAEEPIDIRTWPVKDGQEQLEQIAKTHCVREFIVYDTENSRVEPLDIARKLKGALVECSFKVKHYCFGSNDSFNGEIEQIVILRPAPKQTPSPYKGGTRPYRPPAMSPSEIHAREQLAVEHFTPPIAVAGPSILPVYPTTVVPKRKASVEPQGSDNKRGRRDSTETLDEEDEVGTLVKGKRIETSSESGNNNTE
ncbi:hypothetical protein B0H15DRAFT_1018063 [Mycena belliarum]|uniref:Uncharacterized protein n=1 Tax=Mycena belliarum TaxID=1033014 RepID=A0AAD6UGN0_9AGAR|nr:hypothetical protein B0H15DRAFT_1018063 [Mycena belliae]